MEDRSDDPHVLCPWQPLDEVIENMTHNESEVEVTDRATQYVSVGRGVNSWSKLCIKDVKLPTAAVNLLLDDTHYVKELPTPKNEGIKQENSTFVRPKRVTSVGRGKLKTDYEQVRQVQENGGPGNLSSKLEQVYNASKVKVHRTSWSQEDIPKCYLRGTQSSTEDTKIANSQRSHRTLQGHMNSDTESSEAESSTSNKFDDERIYIHRDRKVTSIDKMSASHLQKPSKFNAFDYMNRYIDSTEESESEFDFASSYSDSTDEYHYRSTDNFTQITRRIPNAKQNSAGHSIQDNDTSTNRYLEFPNHQKYQSKVDVQKSTFPKEKRAMIGKDCYEHYVHARGGRPIHNEVKGHQTQPKRHSAKYREMYLSYIRSVKKILSSQDNHLDKLSFKKLSDAVRRLQQINSCHGSDEEINSCHGSDEDIDELEHKPSYMQLCDAVKRLQHINGCHGNNEENMIDEAATGCERLGEDPGTEENESEYSDSVLDDLLVDGPCILDIHNLPMDVQLYDVFEFMSSFGDVVTCRINRNPPCEDYVGLSARVRMSSSKSADWAVSCLHGSESPFPGTYPTNTPPLLVCSKCDL